MLLSMLLSRTKTMASHRNATKGKTMRSIIAVSLVFVSGCSFLFVESAPPREVATKLGYVECTKSKAPAIIDTVIAVGYALSAGSAFGTAAAGGRDASNATAYGVGAALGGALFTAAAYYGYTSARECEEMKNFVALQPRTDTK